MKKLYLVDVSSMFFRAFYAIRPLTAPSGTPVNAVYGFLSMTVKLLKEIRPDYMAFCFDRPEPSFRKDIDPRYKANRTEMPPDLVPQIPYIRTLSEVLGIPCLDKIGFEADDIIGTLVRVGRDHGLEVVIVSGDKDFAQLVRPFVSMYDTMKDVRYDEPGVIGKWGVEPRKMIDYLAIVGDSSDNVPGIAGLGPKGAQKLLAEFEDLDDIYAHLDRITSKSVRKKLEDGKSEAYLSKRLVSIVQDLAMEVQPEDLRLRPIDREQLSKLLIELDFKSFARTLLGEVPRSAESVEADLARPQEISEQVGRLHEHEAHERSQQKNNSHLTRPPGAEVDGDKLLVPSSQDGALTNDLTPRVHRDAEGVGEAVPSRGFLSENQREPSRFERKVAVASAPLGLSAAWGTQTEASTETDTETSTKANPISNPKSNPKWNDETHTSAWSGGQAAPQFLSPGQIREERLDLLGLERWLQPEAETWALQTERGTYLAQQNQEGWLIAEVGSDAVSLGALLGKKHLKFKGFDVKDFARHHHVERPNVIWDSMLAAYVIRAGSIDSPLPLFSLYSGESLPDLPTPAQLLAAHLRLESQLRRKLDSVSGEKILFEIEQPLVPILLSMEQAGIRIDAAALQQQSASLARDMATLEKEIHAEAGVVFNIGSPKQLAQILFEKMKMPPGRRTKTGYSTDSDVLEKLSKEHPITAKILQWRELTKLKSTYVDAIPQLADRSTARVHTTFNQATTATGRLSSTNPNLQNIPIRTERGNMIRRAFVAEAGHVLVSADYSQIELRILAHITEDPGLVRAFENDLDIHTATASEIFEVPVGDVSAEMRRKAKAVNFGLAYGQGAYGLAETLRISRSEASEIIHRYFTRFAGVKTYMADIVESAKAKGYVETLFGRRRYVDEIHSKSASVRQFGERAAINAPIQGTASDIIKMAMIKVGDPAGGRMLLQVHDELIFEVREQDAPQLSREIVKQMENVVRLKVPLKVNVGSGLNWDDAHS